MATDSEHSRDDPAFTVPPLLRRHADQRPDTALIVVDSDRLTYGEAERRSSALASAFLAAGFGKGSHIGMLYPNSTDAAVAALAANRIGAVSVPLSTLATAFELSEMLRDADIDLLLATPAYRSSDMVANLREVLTDIDLGEPFRRSLRVPTLRGVYFAGEPAGVHPTWRIEHLLAGASTLDDGLLEAAESIVRPSDRMVIVHTSGSTSKPKGVVHTQGSVLRHMAALNRERDYGVGSVMFSNSPFFWIGGYVANLMASLEAGATLVCSNERAAAPVLNLLERERPTLLNGFAAAVQHLADDASFAERDLSFLQHGNLYPIMPARLQPADPELRHNMLGSTEAGSVILYDADESDQPESRRGSFGRLLPGFEAKVIDPETGDSLPVGERGELCLRGPFLMAHYYGKERHEVFHREGWFHTGDLVRVDDDGYYYYLGRRNQMIKTTAGANVSPREVEVAIRDVAGFTAYCVGVDEGAHGQAVGAVLVVAEPTAVDIPQLQEALSRRIAKYKVPKLWRAITAGELPLMSSGKVDLPALKTLLRDQTDPRL